MYKLIARLKRGSKVIGYRIKDLGTGELYDFDKDTFRLRVKQGKILDVRYVKGKIVGKLQNIEEINQAYSNRPFSVYTGISCSRYIQEGLKEIKQHRDVVTECIERLSDTAPNCAKICILSGVRRMGKTVVALKVLEQMQRIGKKIAYIVIDHEVDFSELLNVLYSKEIQQCNIICIDEISRCIKFADQSSVLSNYSHMDRRLILTGTDSFVFPLSLRDQLCGRAYYYNLTMLSYSEYVRIFGRDFESYKCMTSMLDKKPDFNMRMAMTDNIYNSLRRSNIDDSRFKIMRQLSQEELQYYIVNVMVQLVSYMNSKYVTIKTNDIEGITQKEKVNLRHQAMRLLLRNLSDENIISMEDSKRIEYKLALNNEVRNALVELGIVLPISYYNMRDFKSVDEKWERIEQGMYKDRESNMLVPLVEKVYCVKIFGLYMSLLSQFDKFLEMLCNRNGYTFVKIEDLEGEFLENVIRANLVDLFDREYADNWKLAFYHSGDGTEIDIIVFNTITSGLNLFEVKNSTKQDIAFFKHLTNKTVVKNVCDFIGYSGLGTVKSFNRKVIYNGETVADFINIEDFLLEMKKYLI